MLLASAQNHVVARILTGSVAPYPLSSEEFAFAVVDEGGDADAGVSSFCRHYGTSLYIKQKRRR